MVDDEENGNDCHVLGGNFWTFSVVSSLRNRKENVTCRGCRGLSGHAIGEKWNVERKVQKFPKRNEGNEGVASGKGRTCLNIGSEEIWFRATSPGRV